MATIALDVDDLLVEQVPALLAAYNRKYNDNLRPADLKTWGWAQYTRPICGDKLYELFTPQLYVDAVPVDGALAGVQLLREMNHKIIFVTSGPLGIAQAKQDWLKWWGFLKGQGVYGDGRIYEEFFQVNDKAAIRADWLIDDRVETITKFPGSTILFSRPWNKSWTVNSAPMPDGIRHERFDTWAAIVEFFRSIYGDVAAGALNIVLPQEAQDLYKRVVASEQPSGGILKNGVYSTTLEYGTRAGQAAVDDLEALYQHRNASALKVDEVRQAESDKLSSPMSAGGGSGGSWTPSKIIASSPGNWTNRESGKPMQTKNQDMSKGGVKYDEDKVAWTLLPKAALAEVSKVLMYGLKKYSAHNWAKGMTWSRPADATYRHLAAWESGEDNDPETGLSHIAHALCELLFLMSFILAGLTAQDDRPKGFPGVTLPETRYVPTRNDPAAAHQALD